MKRLNIGLMIHYIDSEYSSLVIKGAIDAAKEMNVNIIIYPGRGINEQYDDIKYTEYESQNNILYEYVSKECLDGVIISAGTILSQLSDEERKKFVMRYDNLPVLVLENEIEGYPLIRFSGSGIKEAVIHLYKNCGRKNIGFVGGPKGNSEAQERLFYYKEGLKECNLPIREDYIVYGNFSEYCVELVGQLIDRHLGEIDALCFANDTMCVGGYKALEKRGLVPGREIAITGHDDLQLSQSMKPLLTTVRIDVQKLGYYAVKNLLKIIANEKVESIILDSKLIVRESSGRYLKSAEDKNIYDRDNQAKHPNEPDNILENTIENDTIINSPDFSDKITRLFSDITQDIYAENELDMTKYLDQIYLLWEDIKEDNFSIKTFERYMSELKNNIFHVCKTDQQKLKVSELLSETLSKIYKLNEAMQTAKRTELLNDYMILNDIKKDMLLSRIVGGDDATTVYESILNNLYRAGFKSSYLYMFKEVFVRRKEEAWNIPDKLYLKAYQEEGQLITLDKKDQEHKAMDYLDNQIISHDRQCTMVLNPLYTNEEQYGLLLCELEFEHFSKINFVIPQISYAMKQINLFKKLEKNLEEIKIAKGMAEKASEAKANFLANMSHEIRTPINVILGMNEMILRECEDLNIAEYAQTISRAGSTLLSLINDILDFSKIESGKMEIVSVDYELFSLLNDIVNMISERAESKNLTLKLDFAKDLPSVLNGDEIRIKQVIMNLLTNAVKYTQKGTVTFRMGWMPEKEGYISLLVSVEDTGQGIREEDILKIFRSFERIDEKRNRNIEGTGLGMSITQQILELMDSDLTVESIYGKGSKFSFAIKQKVVNSEPIGNFVDRVNRREAMHKEYQDIFMAPDARILVVDDSEMNLIVVKNLLKVTKMKVDTVSSGLECINKIQNNHYDLILLDHMMPGMDGIETLEQIKNMPEYKMHPVPVIALTANAIAGSREKYIKVGFCDYLAKPIDSNKLQRTLVKYLPNHLIEPIVNREEVGGSSNNECIDNDFKFTHIDAKKGLYHSGNNIKSYEEVLKAYYEEGVKKRKILHRAFGKMDKKQYRISVHTLKSTSKNIGAEELALQSELLENAIRQDDWVYVFHKHDIVYKLYGKVLHELQEFFKKRNKNKLKNSISKEELIQTVKDIKIKVYHLNIVEAVKLLELLKDSICDNKNYEKEASMLIDIVKAYDLDKADLYLQKMIQNLEGD